MIYEKICDVLVEELDIDRALINMDSDIVEDLEADSLDVVDLIMAIEDTYGIEVPDEKIESLRTVGDVVRFIEENTDEE